MLNLAKIQWNVTQLDVDRWGTLWRGASYLWGGVDQPRLPSLHPVNMTTFTASLLIVTFRFLFNSIFFIPFLYFQFHRCDEGRKGDSVNYFLSQQSLLLCKELYQIATLPYPENGSEKLLLSQLSYYALETTWLQHDLPIDIYVEKGFVSPTTLAQIIRTSSYIWNKSEKLQKRLFKINSYFFPLCSESAKLPLKKEKTSSHFP